SGHGRWNLPARSLHPDRSAACAPRRPLDRSVRVHPLLERVSLCECAPDRRGAEDGPDRHRGIHRAVRHSLGGSHGGLEPSHHPRRGLVCNHPATLRARADGRRDQGVRIIMDTYHEASREIPIKYRAAVVVVGGGVAGVSAAIAAARSGADTLLIERYGALGGNLTIGLLEASMSFHDRKGKQLIGGTPDEIMRRLKAAGGSVGHVEDDVGYCGTVTPYDPEELKMVCLEMTRAAGGGPLLPPLGGRRGLEGGAARRAPWLQ